MNSYEKGFRKIANENPYVDDIEGFEKLLYIEETCLKRMIKWLEKILIKKAVIERIKELINALKKKSRNQVIQQCQKEFIDVHKTTDGLSLVSMMMLSTSRRYQKPVGKKIIKKNL